MVKFITSPKFNLNSYDWNRWLHNSLVFLAPVALVALGAMVQQIPSGWAFGAVALYFLNLVTDIIRKWISENTYQK